MQKLKGNYKQHELHQFSPVLASYCCGSKLPHTQWLKTARLLPYSFVGKTM